MPDIVHAKDQMIAGMTPVLRSGDFVFVTTDDHDLRGRLMPLAISMFQEKEGMSLIIPVDAAKAHDLDIDHPMQCITLNVYSSLEGVGLTAAVATALGQSDIPCNMVAAFHHDHVFVPADKAADAIAVLERLQNQAAAAV